MLRVLFSSGVGQYSTSCSSGKGGERESEGIRFECLEGTLQARNGPVNVDDPIESLLVHYINAGLDLASATNRRR